MLLQTTLLLKISLLFDLVIPLHQLINLVNEIHHSFGNTNSLEVHAMFLDMFKAFDNKVWHDGIIFKLKQNGVSGTLLKFL